MGRIGVARIGGAPREASYAGEWVLRRIGGALPARRAEHSDRLSVCTVSSMINDDVPENLTLSLDNVGGRVIAIWGGTGVTPAPHCVYIQCNKIYLPD